ncbi:Growth arrest-specific protein 2-like protein, partial [Leptotrombidium deliense]
EKCSETSHSLESSSKQQQQSGSVDRKQSLEAKWSKTKTPTFSAKTMKCWENAKSESFYARDNVSNFIEWTRALGVRDAVTFETEDLVLHNNQRNVVLCLLEVARIACNKHNFSPAPGLVVFEKEIDEQIEKEASADADSSVFLNDLSSDAKYSHRTGLQLKTRVSSSGASVDDDLDGWSSVQSNHLGRTPSVTSISSTSVGSSTETPAIYGNEPSPLDHKVMLIAKSYYGRKAKHGIQRLAEGKYRIAGKIVFVRLLKDRHVMVRVGGGWDTLQHFLERHGGDSIQADISPSDLLPMDTRPSESTSRRRLSQSSLQSTPATPTLRRCTINTPISRSTMSSPEPWMSGSSGYSSASGGGPRRKSLSRCESACGVSTADVSRRRSLTRRETDNYKGPVSHRASVNLPITKTTESNGETACGVKSSQSSNSISSTYKLSRYPNYLQSSQHITNKSTPTTTGNSRIHTRNSVVRRSSLKAF